MRMLKLIGLTVSTALGVGILGLCASALAVTSTWLVNGAIPAGEVKVIASGSVTIEDMDIEAGITCTGITGSGTVGPGTQGAIMSVSFTPANCIPQVDSLSSKGICPGIDELEALNLPWLTELALGKNAANETVFLNLILNGNGKAGAAGEPGYLVECATSIGLVDDVCVTNLSSSDIDNTAEGDVLALFPLEWAKCSLLGRRSGLAISDGDMGSGFLITAEKAGETLAVSEAWRE